MEEVVEAPGTANPDIIREIEEMELFLFLPLLPEGLPATNQNATEKRERTP